MEYRTSTCKELAKNQIQKSHFILYGLHTWRGHLTVQTDLMNSPRRIPCDKKDSEAARKLTWGVLWLIGNACHRLGEASKEHVLLELNTVRALQSKAAYSVCHSHGLLGVQIQRSSKKIVGVTSDPLGAQQTSRLRFFGARALGSHSVF